jgi:hypothetical protein
LRRWHEHLRDAAWAAEPVDYIMSADARWLISRFQSKLNPGVRV